MWYPVWGLWLPPCAAWRAFLRLAVTGPLEKSMDDRNINKLYYKYIFSFDPWQRCWYCISLIKHRSICQPTINPPWRAAAGGQGTPGEAAVGKRWGSPSYGCSWEEHSARRGSTRRCSSASSSRTPNTSPRLFHLPGGANPGWWRCSSGSPAPLRSPGTDLLTHLEGGGSK